MTRQERVRIKKRKLFIRRVCILCVLVAILVAAVVGIIKLLLNSSPAVDPTEFISEELIISEVMPGNDTFAIDGEYCDWIELYNGGDTDIQLSNYYVSNKAENPYKCRLPEQTLSAGAFVVLKCNGTEITFNLSKDGDSVYLFDLYGKQISKTEFDKVNDNSSFINEIGECKTPSPGYENSYAGYLSYRQNNMSQKIVINEVLSTNTKHYPISGKYYDLIEIKNNTDESINLSEYYISDSKTNLKKFKLSDKNLAKGEYFVLVASGNGGDELNFKVSSSGENLYISDSNGNISDAVVIPPLQSDCSYGRSNDGYAYFTTPSIGKANSGGVSEVLTAPSASVPCGFYESSFNVTLSGDGNIYYTLDGRDPRTNGKLYKGEDIKISKTTAIRAYSKKDNSIPSDVVTLNYFINAPEYELGVLKITAYDDDIFGANGIWTNYSKRGMDWERKANIALFLNGNEEFSIDCGIRIFGSGTRKEQKKSFRVKFRSIYGSSSLKYEVFPGYDIKEFDSLVIRSGVERMEMDMFCDELASTIVRTSDTLGNDMYVQNYRPVNLYINDEYYGIYYIRERLDEDYVASHRNVSADSVKITGTFDAVGGELDKLVTYCKNNNMNDDKVLKYVTDRLSLDCFINYYIARSYTGDKDYGNIRFFKSPEDDGKWRIMFYDVDWGFCGANMKNPLSPYFSSFKYREDRNTTNYLNNALIYELSLNAEIKDLFLTRLASELKGTLSPENVISIIDSIEKELQHDMKYDRERWGLSYSSWTKYVQYMRDFVNNRTAKMIENAQKVFKLSDSQTRKYFGDLME